MIAKKNNTDSMLQIRQPAHMCEQPQEKELWFFWDTFECALRAQYIFQMRISVW